MKFLTFLNACQTKTQLIKIHNSLYSSRSYGRMLEIIKKQGALENYYCLEMISKLALQQIIQKKHPDLGSLETNQRHEIQA